MAKRETKVLPARASAASRDDDSLLIRSAESLGRVVGSLQRQMQGATKRVSSVAESARDALPELPPLRTRAASGSRKRAASRKPAGARTVGAGEASTARKRPATRKAAARKTGGATKTSRARKTTRRSR